MIRNQLSRETILRQQYNNLPGAEREGEKGKQLLAEIKRLQADRYRGSDGKTPIMC